MSEIRGQTVGGRHCPARYGCAKIKIWYLTRPRVRGGGCETTPEKEDGAMEHCPKCGKRLRLYQISQYCPYCGVNLVFANYEPQFQRDRRLAEMSAAHTRITLEKIKKAYLSGLPQKLKILFSLFPVIALFLPFGALTVDSPAYRSTLRFWAMDLFVNAFTGKQLFSSLRPLAGAGDFGTAVSLLRTVMLLFGIAAAAAVLLFLTELFCFMGNRLSGTLLIAFSVVSAFSYLGAVLFAFRLASVSAGTVLQTQLSFLWVPALLFILLPAAAAVWCLKRPPVTEISPEDALRCDYREKYRRGEIGLLEIPAPIAETETEIAEKQKLVAMAYHTGDTDSEGATDDE